MDPNSKLLPRSIHDILTKIFQIIFNGRFVASSVDRL